LYSSTPPGIVRGKEERPLKKRPTLEQQAVDKVSPLRHHRTLREWSLRELAGLVGISESLMSLYETGQRNPPPQVKVQFARVFGVPVEALFPPDLG
jgi:DNA-binding XRE family transcriptional regulator